MQRDSRLPIDLAVAQQERVGVAVRHVLGQVHAIVGAAYFLAEDVDAIVLQGAKGDELFDTVMADHAVADDDQRLSCPGDGV